LGGQGMKIVINKQELEEHVIDLLKSIPGNKLLLDHYLDGAIEAEADAICDADGNVYIIGIMEHIEPCGVHSGDSNATLPPFNLGEFVMQQIKDHTEKIARALQTVGLINIQFAIKDDTVYIIEANPRASRTVPFIAKAYGEPYVNYATKVMLGHNKVTDFTFNPQLKGYAIKQPVFSFSKFPNVNKALRTRNEINRRKYFVHRRFKRRSILRFVRKKKNVLNEVMHKKKIPIERLGFFICKLYP
jgi:carbamoyl-phosphate synthase large subunit